MSSDPPTVPPITLHTLRPWALWTMELGGLAAGLLLATWGLRDSVAHGLGGLWLAGVAGVAGSTAALIGWVAHAERRRRRGRQPLGLRWLGGIAVGTMVSAVWIDVVRIRALAQANEVFAELAVPRPPSGGGDGCHPLHGRGLVRDCAGGVHPAHVLVPSAHRARTPAEIEWIATACRTVHVDAAQFREVSLFPGEPITADVEEWTIAIVGPDDEPWGGLRVGATVPEREQFVPSVYEATPTELAAALGRCGYW